MSSNPNVFTTFPCEDQAASVFETGDVALLLKRDGTVKAVNFGYESARLRLPNELMTDEDREMQKQGARLFALALAATNPQIMQILMDIAADPEVVDFDKLRTMLRLH